MNRKNAETIFNALYEQTFTEAYGYVLAKTGDTRRAPELLQDCFEDVLAYFYQLPEDTVKDKRAYLFSVVQKHLRAFADEQAPTPLPEISDADCVSLMEAELATDILTVQSEKQLSAAVKSVLYFIADQPFLYARAFTLKFLFGFSTPQIAKELSLGEPVVNAMLLRLCTGIRKLLQQQGEIERLGAGTPLKEILSKVKYRVTPDKEQMRRAVLKNTPTPKAPAKTVLSVAAFCAVALLLLTGVGYYTWKYYTFDPSVNIVGNTASLSELVYLHPDHQTPNGVPTDSSVTVVTKRAMSVREFKEHIRVSPDVSFTVQKKAKNRFRIRFAEALEPNTSYVVTSVTNDTPLYRWSLQTEAAFKIDNAYPAEEYIDINTGIEITFSESSVNAFGEFFTISPKVNGSFVHKGRKWTFLPDKPLSPYTSYVVTVSGDIENALGQTLGEDYSFGFTTGASESRYAYISHETFDVTDSFTTAETPVVSLYANGIAARTADLTVYKIDSADTFAALHEKYGTLPVIPTKITEDIKEKNLPVYARFSATAVTDPSSEGKVFLPYPKAMESGYYLTEIVWDGITMYQFVQSSDLSVYAAAHNGKYIVWVNNTQTKLPVDGAAVTVGGVTAATGNDGMAELSPELSDDRNGVLITVTSDTLPPYLIYARACPEEQTVSQNYYSYFYTDSLLYRRTDTVHIWGVVQKRDRQTNTPKVSVYADWNGTEYPVKLTDAGTFVCDIPIENYRLSDTTELSLRINGQTVRQKVLTVENYDLPTYRLQADADKHAYLEGETETVTVRSEYYNNTPAAFVTVINGDTAAVTDQNGSASFALPAAIPNEYFKYSDSTCDPQPATVEFTTDSSLEKTFFTDLPLLVFRNNEYLSAAVTGQKDRLYSFKIGTHQIDLTGINALPDAEFEALYSSPDPALFTGKAVSKAVTAEVHTVTFDREKESSYYDPVTKKMQVSYRFKEKDSVVKTFSVTTNNGTAELKDVKLPSVDGYVYVKFSMTDAAGKGCQRKVYLTEPYDASDDFAYQFRSVDTANVGDTVTLSLWNTKTQAKAGTGSFIYHIISDTVLQTGIGTEGKASFVFSDNCVPDVAVFGARFDGKRTVAVQQKYIASDTAKRNIALSLTPDRSAYHPGDTVKLHLETKNADGKPISAAYNLNVMDEALLSLTYNTPDLTETVFESHAPYEIYQSIPAKTYGEGGGGGDSMRDDFNPTPAFLSGVTDKNGAADISFTLPDSITGWAVFAQAVTDLPETGTARIGITAEKDAFITAQIEDTVKTSDDAVLSFAVGGKKIKADTAVTANVTLTKDKKAVQTVPLSFVGALPQTVNLGRLTKGEYAVTVTAAVGALKDSVQKRFTVTDFTVTVPVLTDGTDYTGETLLMDAAFPEFDKYVNHLLSVAGDRLDGRLGTAFAENMCSFDGADLTFLNDYGIEFGFAPYKENTKADLLLSAGISSLLSDKVDREALGCYFDGIFADKNASAEDVLCALWGKAALGDACEKDIAYYCGDGKPLSTGQYLYCALAYAYGGNQTKANELYQTYILPNIQTENGISVIRSDDAATTERLTALAALLSSRISADTADSLLSYVIKHDSEDSYASLAVIGHLAEYVPKLEGKNTVNIDYADGSHQTVHFDRFAPCRLSGDKKIERITPKDGDTLVKTKAALPLSELIKTSKKLGTVLCMVPPQLTVGDTFDITLSLSAAQTSAVTLALPAGVRYLRSFTADRPCSVTVGADQSMLRIYPAHGKAATLTLHCKAALPGAFTVEPILISNGMGGYYASDPLPITIDAAAPIEEIY